MSQDREDFQNLMKERASAKAQSRASEMLQLKQAAVPARKLMNDESWDYFLSIVQAKIEQLDNQLMRVPALLTNGETVSAEQLYGIQRDVVRLTATRDALESVSVLPKQIAEKGEEAGEALAALG